MGGSGARLPPVPTFGENLRQARERLGWTQEALAAELGRSANSTISTWEKRIAPPRPKTLARLAKALKVSVEELTQGVPTSAELAREVERLADESELTSEGRLDQHIRKDGAVMADPPRDSGFVELIRAYARKVEDLKPLDEEQEWFEEQVAEALRELRRRRRFAPDVEGQQKLEQS